MGNKELILFLSILQLNTLKKLHSLQNIEKLKTCQTILTIDIFKKRVDSHKGSRKSLYLSAWDKKSPH